MQYNYEKAKTLQVADALRFINRANQDSTHAAMALMSNDIGSALNCIEFSLQSLEIAKKTLYAATLQNRPKSRKHRKASAETGMHGSVPGSGRKRRS